MGDEVRENEVEITPEMVEAGEAVILLEPGVAPTGIFFCAADLAVKVYEAMESARHPPKKD